jgi:hypothetical protein
MDCVAALAMTVLEQRSLHTFALMARCARAPHRLPPLIRTRGCREAGCALKVIGQRRSGIFLRRKLNGKCPALPIRAVRNRHRQPIPQADIPEAEISNQSWTGSAPSANEFLREFQRFWPPETVAGRKWPQGEGFPGNSTPKRFSGRTPNGAVFSLPQRRLCTITFGREP